MIKWRTLIFGLIFLSFACSLFAETTKPDRTKAFGGGNYGAESVESIEGNGLIKLNGTTIARDIRMIGSLISQNGIIGSLDVVGAVNLTGTTVKQGGKVVGLIETVRSTIEAPITVLSQKAIFTHTKLVGLTIKQDPSFKGKQIVELRLGTLVDGPIHFESGKGEVLIYQGSQVLGPVTGGKIIKK